MGSALPGARLCFLPPLPELLVPTVNTRSPESRGSGWAWVPTAPGRLPAQLCVSAAPAWRRDVRDPGRPAVGCTEERRGQVPPWLKGRGGRGQGAVWQETRTATAGFWGLLTAAGGCDPTDLPGTSSFQKPQKMLMRSQLLSPILKIYSREIIRERCMYLTKISTEVLVTLSTTTKKNQ